MPKINVLYGEEKYLIDQALEKIKLSTIGQTPDVFSFQVIEGSFQNYSEIIVAMQTIPCFSPQRLVVIRNPFFMLSKKSRGDEDSSEPDESISEEQEKNLGDALKNIPEGVTVVFLINGNIDQRRKMTQALKELTVFNEYKPFAFWEQEKLYEWLINLFKEKGYQLSSEGAELLTQIAGNSLEALSNEIEKIITFVGKKQKIEIADIKQIVSPGDLAGFELQDALCFRDIRTALEVISQLSKQGEAAVAIMGMLNSLFRLMGQVKELADQRLDHYAIAKELNKKPFYIKKIYAGAKNYTLAEIKRILVELHNSDYKIKTGRMPQQLALEYAVGCIAR